MNAPAPAEDRAAVRIFPPAVPLATVLTGALLEAIWPTASVFGLPEMLRYWIGGIVVGGSVMALGIWPVSIFRRAGQSPKPWTPTPSLVQEGPYRVTRNPMYLQMVVACVGIAVAFANLWILLLTPICAWVLHRFAVLPEEAYLEAKFGEAYRSYMRRVRRWI